MEEQSDCHHSMENQVIFIGQDGKVYGKCGNCSFIFSLTLDYFTHIFKSSRAPTMHDLEIFNITELDDGTFLYERKSIEKN